MYALPPLQAYRDEGDIDRSCDSSIGSDLNSTFDAGLERARSVKHLGSR
jgi:hypothetical protein